MHLCLLQPRCRKLCGVFSEKMLLFCSEELDYCLPLFHCEEEMLRVLCQVINHPP